MTEKTVAKSYDPLAHRRGEPRLFIVFWTIYLLIASAVALGPLGFHGLAGTDLYRPNATLLLCLCGCGLGLLWPMVRLSQAKPGRPLWAFVVDAIAVSFPAAIVVVAQSMPWMAAWSAYEGTLMIVSYLSWAALIVCILNLAVSQSRTTPNLHVQGEHDVPRRTNLMSSRGVWMFLVALLVVAGPVVGTLLSIYTDNHWAMKLTLLASPITVPFAATSREIATLGEWGLFKPAELIVASIPSLVAIPMILKQTWSRK